MSGGFSISVFVDPVKDLGGGLLNVEKPARYVGGEYGILARKDAGFQTAICFPDLYEIGMSNQALRIIYNRLNGMEGISCDRAFAPAPDFEALLREKGLPLYGLDTGLSLGNTDMLLFTLGYELGITGVLTMLDLAGLSLHAEDRNESDPLVVMGGPCVSNPLPYAAFVDAFWIGEAEGGFFDLVCEAEKLKRRGGRRGDVLALLLEHPSVWAKGKAAARRAVDWDFPNRPPAAAVFPVPSMKVVQHHGAVEIMRGCPNGCRFCHAGFWYRPMRQKSAAVVKAEAASFINRGGYREISLSSLSTGDYRGIGDLIESLNRETGSGHVSFQLPSLKVSTFSLSLLEKISEVRKSGLTFAVETPEDLWQLSINKSVSLESVVNIIREARRHGWRGAKFYFMIGLPVTGSGTAEEESIVDFVLKAAAATGMHFNINVGTFVPKPHTPYQRSGQLDEESSRKKLEFIRTSLKKRGHKTGIQDPFISVIEGLLSRGDERVGGFIEEAWKKGCRLDAWSEYLKYDVWRSIIDSRSDYVKRVMAPNNSDMAPLPWECIKSGVSAQYFSAEYDMSAARENTSPCMKNCNHPCGICHEDCGIVYNNIHDENISHVNPQNGQSVSSAEPQKSDPPTYKMLFMFSKSGPGIFYPHLTVIEIFSMAFLRAGIPVRYTSGFNPLPRLEVVSPLGIGIAADGEMAAVEIDRPLSAGEFTQRLNASFPLGITVKDALGIFIPAGEKKYSLSAMLWGSLYDDGTKAGKPVPFKDEKTYRQERETYGLKRLAVLAKDPENPENPKPYFEVFKTLYLRPSGNE
jgi:radical SAM superfamily enzyme YgiQ (UPF0313 family)